MCIYSYLVLVLHYMYLTPLVTSQMWMNDVKSNQVLNQTLVPPGVNPQATLQYTKYFKASICPLSGLTLTTMSSVGYREHKMNISTSTVSICFQINKQSVQSK